MKQTLRTTLLSILFASICAIVFAQGYDPENYEYHDAAPCVDITAFPLDAEGYYILFDGTSLNGWRGWGRDYVPEGWSIREGLLSFVPTPKKEEDLIFSYKFKNFVLEVEWNMSYEGNSGIFFLASEVRSYTKKGREYYRDIYITSPEYQLLDNEHNPDAFNGTEGTHKAAALYDMIPPKVFNTNPYGTWNKAKIVCKDGHIEHWQNGVKVVEYQLWTDEWNDMIDRSKFSKTNWPMANRLLKEIGRDEHKGYIGFQDHDSMFFLRNIRVKVLED